MDRKREKMGMQCYMKKEDNSLIDVENAETTGERCLSWRTPLNSSLCTFIGMKHISPTFMYIIPMYLRLTTFTKTLPQMSFHLYIFCYFYFALELHPWLCWQLERSQILGCPRQLQTCARLMQGWVASAGWQIFFLTMFWQQSQYDSMLRFSSRVFVRVRVIVRLGLGLELVIGLWLGLRFRVKVMVRVRVGFMVRVRIRVNLTLTLTKTLKCKP